AVDLVAEQDGAATHRTAAGLSLPDNLANARNALRDRAELHERGIRPIRDDPRDGRLAGARRPPEDDAADCVLLDQLAQRPAGSEQMLLTDVLVQRAHRHASRERRPRLRTFAALVRAGCVVAALVEIDLAIGSVYTPGQWACPTRRVARQLAATPRNTPACTFQSCSCWD